MSRTPDTQVKPRRRPVHSPKLLLIAVILWVVGLLTLVPYGTWYLLFHATRDQYAWLITLVLFWVFGYWGVVGPLIMVVKVRRVFRAIEMAGSSADLEQALTNAEARDVAIDVIATENHIPRFVASRVYYLILSQMRKHPDVWQRILERGRQ